MTHGPITGEIDRSLQPFGELGVIREQVQAPKRDETVLGDKY